MSEKMKNIPKLRFPEFLDDGEWEEKTLKKLAKNLDNKRVPITSNVRSNGDIPYYGASGIVDFVNDYIFDEELLCISEDGANLVARTYPIAFSISGKTWVNNHAHVLKFQNKCTQIIVENYLNSIKLDDFLTGMAQPKLNKAMLDIIPIPISPKPKEQQKIADCLSSVDNLITAGSKKVETLKEHKKALMQQLFPQDGEEVPKLRFPEFKNAPKWEEKPLNKVCEINPSSKNLPKRFVYIDLESVESGILLQRKIINLDNAPSRAQRLLQKEDIIFQMVRPYQKNNYFFDIDDDYNYVASTGYAQLRAYQSTKYLYHFLHSDGFVSNVLAKCTGSNYPAINSNDLSEITISIPKPDEQQKIANFLSSIDELITSSTKKLQTLKEHKIALMQQLFPSKEVD